MISAPEERNTAAPCRASIVIATHDRRADLAECLESVRLQLLPEYDVEIVVIDDASSDDTPAMVRERFPEVRFIVNEENKGPAYSRNVASRAARGRLLIYLDSDGAVTPGWLDAMLAADDGHTVLLGCAVDYASGRVQRLPRRATFIGKSLQCRPERANTGPSCNLGVPRACFDRLNGFDEEIPHYFEDSDLCIRAGRAGFGFRYLPEAVFRHKGCDIAQGEAIAKQEHNSTYAMLKAYRGRWFHLAAFTALNGAWVAIRLVQWSLSGRIKDCARLWRGWSSAYRRYWGAGV